MFKKREGWVELSSKIFIPAQVFFFIDYLGIPLTYLSGKNIANFEITKLDLLLIGLYTIQRIRQDKSKNDTPASTINTVTKETTPDKVTETNITSTP